MRQVTGSMANPHAAALDADWRALARHRITVTGEQYDDFVALLERPVQVKPRLVALLHGPSIFDGSESGEDPTPG